ncbi:MAG: hypothetical protein ACRCYX_07980 [Dermatophilaceae bacterium]
MRSERGDAAAGLIRALALAWFAVGTAGLAHGTAGGHTPDAGSVAVLVAVVGIGGAPLFTHRLARPRAVLVVIATQLLTHLVLAASAGAGSATPGSLATPGSPLPGTHHGVLPGAAGRHSTAPLLDAAPLLNVTPRMALSHLLAAALVVLVLRGVEESWGRRVAMVSGLATVAQALVRIARSMSPTPVAPVAGAVRLSTCVAAERHPVAVVRDVWRSPVRGRRGPPIVATP